MKGKHMMALLCAVVWSLSICAGCGRQEQESKPAPEMEAPAPEQAATQEESEAGIDLLKIKEAAMKEKDLIMEKKEKLQDLIAEKADTPLTEQMGEEAKKTAQQIDELKNEIQEHKDRYSGYMEKLKAGDVDTSGLALP
jgi:hypothetical protein